MAATSENGQKSRQDLKKRTRQFALRVVRLYAALPRNNVTDVLGKQVLRSGTSVGAHYHEAYRSRSPAEYVSKLTVAMQELEETSYWLELIIEAGILQRKRLMPLLSEVDELLAIFFKSSRRAKSGRAQNQPG